MNQAEFIVLAGPTGVGKSAAAAELAEALNGEIIGADAFQIYKGLSILTAQPDAALLNRIPHHLIGSVSPTESFDAGMYSKLAEAAIASVRGRGKIPILTGGTGLYIKALTHGLIETPQIDPQIREELNALSLEELLKRLEKHDPEIIGNIDIKNRRRVQRALEISLQTGTPASVLRQEWEQPMRPCKGVLLTRDREDLIERIHCNVAKMPELGVMEEIHNIGHVGLTARKAIGYEDALLHLNGQLNLAEWMQRTEQASRRYAKRQLTWFKNQTIFLPLNLSAISNVRDSLMAALATPLAQTE
ncbi:MAG: tRNA (adenosine(37)-N6)-dimethylallyltransferase MiaA [Chthoniobacterales bacterium]